MGRYACDARGWIYDPANGVAEANVAPGAKWEDVPGEFVCPGCGAGKNMFIPK